MIFALDLIYLLNRQAWDQNLFDWAIRVGGGFIMRILSMCWKLSISYCIHSGSLHLHTEYAQKVSEGTRHTEYIQKAF